MRTAPARVKDPLSRPAGEVAARGTAGEGAGGDPCIGWRKSVRAVTGSGL